MQKIIMNETSMESSMEIYILLVISEPNLLENFIGDIVNDIHNLANISAMKMSINNYYINEFADKH